MKIVKQFTILLITIFVSSLTLGFMFQTKSIVATTDQDESETNMGVNTF